MTSGARLDGFKKAVSGKLDIVQTVSADWDRQKALTAATDILRARPGLKGFFAANDDMGLGIVRAIQNAGKAGKVKVISVDGIKDALESVGQGQLTATVSQYPYSIGQMGMEALQGRRVRQAAPRQRRGPSAAGDQGRRRQGHQQLPEAVRLLRRPLQGARRLTIARHPGTGVIQSPAPAAEEHHV